MAAVHTLAGFAPQISRCGCAKWPLTLFVFFQFSRSSSRSSRQVLASPNNADLWSNPVSPTTISPTQGPISHKINCRRAKCAPNSKPSRLGLRARRNHFDVLKHIKSQPPPRGQTVGEPTTASGAPHQVRHPQLPVPAEDLDHGTHCSERRPDTTPGFGVLAILPSMEPESTPQRLGHLAILP